MKQLLPECLVGTQRKHFLFDILYYYLGYTVDLLIYADLHKVDFFFDLVSFAIHTKARK